MGAHYDFVALIAVEQGQWTEGRRNAGYLSSAAAIWGMCWVIKQPRRLDEQQVHEFDWKFDECC